MTTDLTAKELLYKSDDDRIKPFLNKIWPQTLGAFFGIGTGVIMNFGTRRPAFSGIQKHIIASALWIGGLTFAQKKRNEYYAEKDAVLRHYLELHPDDFPDPERVKIGDLLEPWIPIR